MGRQHFSSAPKYVVKPEPACEDQVFATWADQEFDPEAEVLSGHVMVYEAFLDKDGRPPLPDDGDMSETISDTSSSGATEELETFRGPRTSAGIDAPASPTLSVRSVEPATNEFDDFVRVEVPPSDSLATTPVAHPYRPSSPLRQSVTLDDIPDHLASDAPEVALQRGDEERLFAYYQSYTSLPERERERSHHGARVPQRPWATAQARRVPGSSRFLVPTVTRVGTDGQRAPLANVGAGAHQPRTRSASFSEVMAAGTRVSERLAAIDGTVISNQVLAAQR